MDSIIERALSSYYAAEQSLQKRVEEGNQPWIPGTDPLSIVLANLAYLVITGLLYSYMSKQKEGYSLKKFMMVYNVICVFLAGYVVVGLLFLKLKNPGTFACNKTVTGSKEGLEYAHYFYVFYAQKYWEFIDTWIFILRKSFRQVTFLHLYHHSSITFVVGLIFPYDYSGDLYLPIFLNSFIHVLMYSHYLATALGIKSWWSSYLTSVQLIQFVLIAVQNYIAWTSGPACGTPDCFKLLLIGYMFTMLIFFGNFFIKKYFLPQKDKKLD
jgi:elongation of very long chain fatty acids protein 4